MIAACMRTRIPLFLPVLSLNNVSKANLYLTPRVIKYTSILPLRTYLLAAFPRSNIETLFSEYG